eukprot:EG_transcript_18257
MEARHPNGASPPSCPTALDLWWCLYIVRANPAIIVEWFADPPCEGALPSLSFVCWWVCTFAEPNTRWHKHSGGSKLSPERNTMRPFSQTLSVPVSAHSPFRGIHVSHWGTTAHQRKAPQLWPSCPWGDPDPALYKACHTQTPAELPQVEANVSEVGFWSCIGAQPSPLCFVDLLLPNCICLHKDFLQRVISHPSAFPAKQ